VILDNLKSGVLKADLYDPRFNKGYEELAHHYHILLDPARLGHAKDKPRVERIIPYIRDSFWAGRTFQSPEEINRELLSWCLKVAGRRIHVLPDGSLWKLLEKQSKWHYSLYRRSL